MNTFILVKEAAQNMNLTEAQFMRLCKRNGFELYDMGGVKMVEDFVLDSLLEKESKKQRISKQNKKLKDFERRKKIAENAMVGEFLQINDENTYESILAQINSKSLENLNSSPLLASMAKPKEQNLKNSTKTSSISGSAKKTGTVEGGES